MSAFIGRMGRYISYLGIVVLAFLASTRLVAAPGWVGYRPSPYSPAGARLYYPAAGAVLGFAVAIVDETDAFVADPTTWPALILMDAN